MDKHGITQCGGVLGRGTDIANLAVRSTFDSARARKRNTCFIFRDVPNVFYSILRGLVVQCQDGDEYIAHTIKELELGPDAVHDLVDISSQDFINASLPSIPTPQTIRPPVT